MPNDCPYCGKPHFNFGDDEEGVEMWINEPNDGEYVIVADPPFAWSTPINICPFCGRKLSTAKSVERPDRLSPGTRSSRMSADGTRRAKHGTRGRNDYR